MITLMYRERMPVIRNLLWRRKCRVCQKPNYLHWLWTSAQDIISRKSRFTAQRGCQVLLTSKFIFHIVPTSVCVIICLVVAFSMLLRNIRLARHHTAHLNWGEFKTLPLTSLCNWTTKCSSRNSLKHKSRSTAGLISIFYVIFFVFTQQSSSYTGYIV